MKQPAPNHRLVYSSGSGRICPECSLPVKECSCRRKAGQPAADGIVRLRRESKGRGGKTVTVISGISLPEAGLQDVARLLKKRCGSGGTIRDGMVEIQGDHREILLTELSRLGYKVKLAGG